MLEVLASYGLTDAAIVLGCVVGAAAALALVMYVARDLEAYRARLKAMNDEELKGEGWDIR